MAQSKNGTSKSIVLPEPIEEIKDKKIDIFKGIELASSLFNKRGRAIYGNDASRWKASSLLRDIIREIKELLKDRQRPVMELDAEARIAGVEFQRGVNRF